MAVETGAPILPIGLGGLIDVLPSLRQGRRATVTVRIGKPFSPFHVEGKGRRPELEAVGDEIMRRIAELIPPARQLRGLQQRKA